MFDRGPRGLFVEFRETTPTGTKKVRLALHTQDREVAKQKADELALTFRTQTRAKPTELQLGPLFDIYTKEISPRKGTSAQWHDAMAAEMFTRYWGPHRLVKTLSVVDLNRFVAERKRGTIGPERAKPGRPVGNRAVEKDLRFLHAVLNFATVARDSTGEFLLERNPLKGLPIPKEESPKRQMLATEDYTTLLDVAPSIHPLLALAMLLCHETGHRISAVRQLRWSDLDLERQLVTWRATTDKIGFEHTTPLTGEAVRALLAHRKSQAAIGDTWVFPAPRKAGEPCSRYTMEQWWDRAVDTAGLAPVAGRGFHSLRRKWASEMKHTLLRDLAHMGGWKNPATLLAVYQQPDLDTQVAALAAARKQIRSVAQG